jgi:aspartyl protease family protein
MRTLFFAFVLIAAAPMAYGGSAKLVRGDGGHFWAETRINGRSVKTLVDTGASLVALTAADARRAGVTVRPKDFVHKVNTANGQTAAARVTLQTVEVGTIKLRNVEAIVLRDGLSVSLLGMSWIGEVRSVKVKGAEMRLED